MDHRGNVPGAPTRGFGESGSGTRKATGSGEYSTSEQPIVGVSMQLAQWKLVRWYLPFVWLLPRRQTSTARADAESPQSS